MPENTQSNRCKTPKWKIVKPIPPLMIPKRVLQDSNQSRSKPVIKAPKPLSEKSDKDSYKLLLLIRELALAQEREEALNACISKEREEKLKVSLDFSRSTQQLDELQRKEQSLNHQLRESSKIISHYEKEILHLRDKPRIEKSSIGVGTDVIHQDILHDKKEFIKLNDKDAGHSNLQYFLNLCRQNEMSISYLVDSNEKMDTTSSITESQTSLIDQKIQILNEIHQASQISEKLNDKTTKQMSDTGIQTENLIPIDDKAVNATPDDLKFIMNAYGPNSKIKETTENSVSFKDRISFFHKAPCFKTSPKNSICTCTKKSNSTKTSTESSNNDLFLLQDETSMLVPLPDLLAELEESEKSSESNAHIEYDDFMNHQDGTDDLTNLIEILNF